MISKYIKLLMFAVCLFVGGLTVTPIVSAEVVKTTAEEQLLGCPAEVSYFQVTNSSGATFLPRKGISRDCWRALNGTQEGDPGNDDDDGDDC